MDFERVQCNSLLNFRSRAISKRNALFSKSLWLLVNDGVEIEEARKTVRAALRERQSRNKRRGAGGQSGQTDEVVIADDLCDDSEITCDTGKN